MATKSINKWIIWLVIWTTVAWVAKMASTDDGKKKLTTLKDKALGVIQDGLDFIKGWINEIKKQRDTDQNDKKIS